MAGVAVGAAGSAAEATASITTTATTPSRTARTLRAGTPEETTVYDYDSGVPGPTAFVVGGVHGDERAGYLAADDVASWEVSAGRLVVVPRANAPAIRADSRTGSAGDLNRHFPPLRAPTSALARAIWNEISVVGPDLFVDLHEARRLYTQGSIAQTLGYYPVGNVRDTAGTALAAVNETVSDERYRFYRRILPGPLEEPKGPLVKRMALETTTPSYIVETYRELPLDDRVTQQKRFVRRLLDERIRTFADAPDWNRLHVRGRGSPIDYEFTVSGRIRKRRQSSVESRDLVLGDQVFGTVSTSEWDQYEFTGSLEAFALLSGRPSDVAVRVNGTARRLSELALADAREIRVIGSGTRVDYEFGTSGQIVKSRSLRVDSDDLVWSGRASGYVVDAGDAYRFTGDLVGFTVTGGDPSDVTVTVDGTERSVGSLDPASARVVTFESLGSEVEYQFAVDGTVMRNGPNAADRMFGSRAFGTVDGWTNGYRYVGDITALEVTAGSESDLRVTVDGTRVPAGAFPSYPER